MPRRSKNWDEALALKLKNPEFAKHYLLALVNDEKLTLKEALRDVIQSYGISEFAEVCGIAQPNLSRALEEGSNPTLSTLEKLLEPFSLSLSVSDLGDSGAA